MIRRGSASFLPDRLSALSPRGIAVLRPLWIALLAATIVLDIAGTVFVWRDFAERDLIFARLALVSEVENDGSVTFGSLPMERAPGPVLPAASRIVSIDGRAIPATSRVWQVAERLDVPDGRTVRLGARTPDGRSITFAIRASDDYARIASEGAALSREVRMGYRLTLSLLTCIILITCATMLYLRRPSDPVAMLFSGSFLLFAGSIDPPLALWMALGWGNFMDATMSTGWWLLVVGLACFPDGRFVPRALRWTPLLAVPAAVVIAIDRVPLMLQVPIIFGMPLALIALQWLRLRNYEAGIERQQIKWALFGFASGLILIAMALGLVPLMPEAPALQAYFGMLLLFLMDAGFILMALGLLVSLIRFRLWEADRVISKSAVSAGVTLLVAVIWTMSMDFVKSGVEFVLGEDNAAIATIAGAVLAAGIFTPTQAIALRWAKQRLQSNQDRMEKLVARLAVWRTSESPAEIAQRALAALAASTHSTNSAILLDHARGRTLLAARGLAEPEALEAAEWTPQADGRFPITLTLEDEDGPVGLLVAGPRNDANRYNADELESFRMLAEPLAESLRVARRRAAESETVQRVLGSVEERLARLEGGGPLLSPG